MKHMSDKDLAKWTRMRRHGRTGFIIKFGVIGWGVTTGVGVGIIKWLWAHYTGSLFLPDDLVVIASIAFIAFPIGGIFFGMITWKYNERLYLKSVLGHCAQCGYNLRGVQSDVCPECGSDPTP